MIIAQYTTSASGIVPRFNQGYVYEVNEIDNGDGTYTVTLTADNDFTYVDFTDFDDEEYNLLSIEYLKVTNKVTTMDYMFYNCGALTSVNANGWDTSNIINMVETFCYCCSLEKIIGIENWNTSSLTDLTYTFYCCESLTSLNLSGWDTSNVTLADATFSDCTCLEELDLSNWDLSSVDTDWLSDIFYISELDPNSEYYIETFKPYLKTIKCNNANTISLIGPYLQNRSTCEEAGVITTNAIIDTSMLASKNWEIDIFAVLVAKYTFDKSIEETMIPVFNNGFDYIIEDEYLNVENENIVTRSIYSNVDFTSCSFMSYVDGKIQYHPSLLTVEYLKVTNKVTSFNELFRGCSNLTKVDTTGWDTSNVTNMSSAFYSCQKLELNLNNLNTSNVTNMGSMFSYANTDAMQGLEDLDVSKVSYFGFMFYGCYSTKLDLSKWDMSSSTSLYVMFTTCSNLTSLKVSNWNTSNVTSMNATFWYVDRLKKLDVSGWTSDKCTNMVQLFGHMHALEELDLGNLKIIDNFLIVFECLFRYLVVLLLPFCRMCVYLLQ